jgi:hypothetical protein
MLLSAAGVGMDAGNPYLCKHATVDQTGNLDSCVDRADNSVPYKMYSRVESMPLQES